MAACGSLQHFFEKPMPENPTLIEALNAWKQIKSMKPVELSSFAEIFGELHFKEKPESSIPPPSSSSSTSLASSPLDQSQSPKPKEKDPSSDSSVEASKNRYTSCFKHNDGFSTNNSESLQLCTEGLGFESSDDVEDSKSKDGDDCGNQEKDKVFGSVRISENLNGGGCIKRSRTNGTFPPPISSIGRSGKPWVYFRSYRHDGRFVLKEIRIPNQEFLHACREDGRLKLHFLHPDDESAEEDDGQEEEKEEEEKPFSEMSNEVS